MPFHIVDFEDNLWIELARTTTKSNYVINYIDSLGHSSNVSLLVETDYVDKDFLVDFSYYYSRCFENIKKKTTRVHFFSLQTEALTKLLYSILDDPTIVEENELKVLSEHYLGFMTFKPLTKTSIGRTIFKPYPKLDHEGNERHFPVYSLNSANIGGIDIKLEALPFQEQDRNVAACATTAIWIALQALNRISENSSFYSQYELTKLAIESFGNMGNRTFPNEGLYTFQILNLFQRIGFDTIYYQLENQENWFISNVIQAHMDIGTPLLAELSIINQNDLIEGHLVTISGYKTRKKSKEIMELYIHDDQIGFYSKVELSNDNYKSWHNEWITKFGMKQVILKSIIAPVYHKIRVPFNSVLLFCVNYLKLNNNQLNNLKIRLYTLRMFRNYLRKHHEIYRDSKSYYNGDIHNYSSRDILTLNLPKYLWVAIIKTDKKDLLIVFDATSYTVSNVLSIY